MYDFYDNDSMYEAIVSSVRDHRRRMSMKELRLHMMLAGGRRTTHLRAVLEEENNEK